MVANLLVTELESPAVFQFRFAYPCCCGRFDHLCFNVLVVYCRFRPDGNTTVSLNARYCDCTTLVSDYCSITDYHHCTSDCRRDGSTWILRSIPTYKAMGETLFTEADYLFPNFIATYLPMGIAGLVVSGIFAAAMSSLDSGINSIVSIVSADFINRFRKHEHSQQHNVKLAKYLVLSIGIAIVLISSIMDKVPGNITEVTSKTNGLFVVPY